MKIKEILALLVGATAQEVYTQYKPGQVPIRLISSNIEPIKRLIADAIDQRR